ncbi:hypothetical protein SASPL_145344 [Salvia splendens]|uniref:Uncharacterized protein n=1 Tax=Salvia splendens TaxID=180675 RepID=A0A8X8Z8A3_SALSN|nr:hypothetical protein SASPL_145344 [Salvia splendens]
MEEKEPWVVDCDEKLAGEETLQTAGGVVDRISPSELLGASGDGLKPRAEEDRSLVVAELCDTAADLKAPTLDMDSLNATMLDHEVHANIDLAESRVLQVANFEISRVKSIMAGTGSIERFFGTWEKIELILASILGAKNAPIPRPTSKLKVLDFRKTHTQESLNINPSSIHTSPKLRKNILNPKASQLLLPSFEPSPTTKLPKHFTTSRPSQPSKNTRNLKPSSQNYKPKKKDIPPTPSPESMAMMDRSLIQEPSQEGSSRTSQGSGKDKPNKTMADVLKGGQPKIANVPFILDPNKVKQRGTASQENEQGDQPRGKQQTVQTQVESGWNRVGKKGTVLRDSTAQEQNKGVQTPRTPLKRARERRREAQRAELGIEKKRRLRRLEELEGRAMSETEGSEFETDDEGKSESRPRSLSPTLRESRLPDHEDYTGLGVHSNRFDILEDEDPETESSMAMVLHDGTAEAQIIYEARMAKGVRNGAAGNGSSLMEIASDGDRRPMIKAPMKKARVSIPHIL